MDFFLNSYFLRMLNPPEGIKTKKPTPRREQAFLYDEKTNLPRLFKLKKKKVVLSSGHRVRIFVSFDLSNFFPIVRPRDLKSWYFSYLFRELYSLTFVRYKLFYRRRWETMSLEDGFEPGEITFL